MKRETRHTSQGKNRIEVMAIIAVALAAFTLTPTTGYAQITIDDSGSAGATGITGSFTFTDFFDAEGSDKLVVTVSVERDRSDPNTKIAEVTYNGTPMVEAIQFKDAVNYNPPGIGPAAIFYLDNPGAGGAIIVNGSAKLNGAHGSWLALSGTAEGVGATNGSIGISTSITTAVNDSLVIAHNHVNDGGAVPVALEPLTPLLSSDQRYSEAAAGYQMVSEGGTTVTPEFSEGLTPVTVAAVFEPPASAGIPVFTGDANCDGSINIADAVNILTYYFAGGEACCLVNMDANDDESVNIADAVTLLSYIFTEGTLTGPDGMEIVTPGCYEYDEADVPEAIGECATPCTAE